MNAKEKVKNWEDNTPLVGSPKQIALATDLRHKAFEKLAEDELVDEVWTCIALFTRDLREKAANSNNDFCVKLWRNFSQMYPALAPQSGVKPPRKETFATMKQLYNDVADRVVKFKESGTWINARTDYCLSNGGYLPINLACLNILAKGETITEEQFTMFKLNIFSEQ